MWVAINRVHKEAVFNPLTSKIVWVALYTKKPCLTPWVKIVWVAINRLHKEAVFNPLTSKIVWVAIKLLHTQEKHVNPLCTGYYYANVLWTLGAVIWGNGSNQACTCYWVYVTLYTWRHVNVYCTLRGKVTVTKLPTWLPYWLSSYLCRKSTMTGQDWNSTLIPWGTVCDKQDAYSRKEGKYNSWTFFLIYSLPFQDRAITR